MKVSETDKEQARAIVEQYGVDEDGWINARPEDLIDDFTTALATREQQVRAEEGNARTLLQEALSVLGYMSAMNVSNPSEECWCYTHVSNRSNKMVQANDHWPICERVRALEHAAKEGK